MMTENTTTTLDVQRSTFAVDIRTTTHIAAPASEVWSVLAATDQWPDWNPFVVRLEGDATVPGSRLDVMLDLPDRDPQRLRPRVVTWDPGRRFSWLGRLGIPGLLDGEHVFETTPNGDGTSFVQRERLVGLLVPTVRSLLAEQTPRGFVALNEALRERVEHG